MRTSFYSILCVVVRMGAVLLFVNTLVSITSWLLVSAGDWGSAASANGIALGFAATALIVACALWVYPGFIARIAAANASRQVFESPIAAADIQYIAFAVVGVWLAVNALLGLIPAGVRLILVYRVAMSEDNRLDQEIAGLIALVIKFAIGIGLAFGARALVGLLRGFREHGLPAPVLSDAAERAESRRQTMNHDDR